MESKKKVVTVRMDDVLVSMCVPHVVEEHEVEAWCVEFLREYSNKAVGLADMSGAVPIGWQLC